MSSAINLISNLFYLRFSYNLKPAPSCIHTRTHAHMYIYIFIYAQDVLGSIPARKGHKNLCWPREPSEYVRFCRAVKGSGSLLLNTQYKPRTTQQHSLQTLYTLDLDLGTFPTAPYVACMRKGFLLQVTHVSLYNMIKISKSKIGFELYRSFYNR